jgi:hypothetical protein
MKFVEGGWYQIRGGDRVYKIRQAVPEAKPFVWVCGHHTWLADGKYGDDGQDRPMDLVRRVMPPVDYVPVKKWLWEFDANSGDFRVTMRSVIHTEDHPSIIKHLTHSEWRKVEGSEVEE